MDNITEKFQKVSARSDMTTAAPFVSLPHPFADPYDLHCYLGVSVIERIHEKAYTFRYASRDALSVSLVSGFLSWDNGKKMTKNENGVWELLLTSENSLEGEAYKYKVTTEDGVFYRTDPFARREEGKGGFASVIATESFAERGDAAWREQLHEKCPLHILEASSTSFATHANKLPYEEGASFSWRELGRGYAIYLKSTGYTHLKLIARDYTESSSYFAPSPRHGTPEEFRQMITFLHRNGVGVIYSLPYPQNADDTALLLSASDHLLSYYGVDGIWFEASRAFSQDEAERLLASLAVLKARYPKATFGYDRVGGVSLYPDLLSRSFEREKILTDHLALTPSERPSHQEKLVAALLEQDTLASQSKALTRGGESSLMADFYGSYEQKFAESRLYYMLLAASSGHKLSFMLSSLAPFRPWRDDLLPEWYMADFKLHRAHRRFVRALNACYLRYPALFDRTSTSLHYRSAENGVFSLQLTSGKDELLFVFNCSDTLFSDYTFPVPHPAYTELFSSDEESFAGEGYVHRLALHAHEGKLTLNLAPLSAVILQPKGSLA